MSGIIAIGTYVPYLRLSRRAIASAWGSASLPGERAMASYDEDALTLGAAAAASCLAQVDSQTVDGLFFASTTAPYAEKSCAVLLSTVTDLRTDVLTADFGGSLRAGTAALRSALDAVKAGSARRVLVVAADCRPAEPGSDLEPVIGDAAAALLVGDEGAGLGVEAMASVTQEFTDVWRSSEQVYLRTDDVAFARTHGYGHSVGQAVGALLRTAGRSPADFTSVALYSPDLRSHARLADALGFNPRTQLAAVPANVGNAGTAAVFLSLASAVETAEPGQCLLLASYGEGSDAFSLRTTDCVSDLQSRSPGLSPDRWPGQTVENYAHYLRRRGLIKTGPPLQPFASLTQLHREERQNLRLWGLRCNDCEAIQYPVRRVCWNCGAKDDFSEVKLARQGEVFTFSMDYLYPSPAPPTIMAVVDLAGGGRLFTQMTDCDPEEMKVGLPVELTLRRLHEGKGVHNYFWKARPARG